MKPLAILISSFILASSLQASTNGDSLSYLTSSDTVMLEILPDQRKFTTHIFAPKQTVYSLSRFYAQDIDQVLALNPELQHNDPSIGQEVKIGVPNIAITRFRTSEFDLDMYAPVCYTVQAGETMYKIAKRVFRMPVDTLMAVNKLSSTALSPGQILQVGWIPTKGVANKIKPIKIDPLHRISYANYKQYAKQTSKISSRRGVASWTPGSGEASGKLFALVAGIPRGQIIKVTNTTNNKFVFVRVIGSPANNTRQANVDIQLSGTAARILDARERNFYVLIE